MTSKQRAYLMSQASTLDPIFQIGKASLTPEIITALDEALEKRELMPNNLFGTYEEIYSNWKNKMIHAANINSRYLSFVTMNSCQELIGMIELNERVPDILIMDVNLKDGNGIETVKEIQQLHPKLKVIYLTGIIDYATSIFETNPAYFLVKPISKSPYIYLLLKF